MPWIMHNSKHFTREENGMVAYLWIDGFYPTWTILRDRKMIDAAQYHRPVTSRCNKELAAKAMVEKRLKELKAAEDVIFIPE